MSKNCVEDIKNQMQLSVTSVFREFGTVGVITYVGGWVILSGFLKEQDLQRQILFGVVGSFLLLLSACIAYFRIRTQRDREQALIDMVKNTSNRLAEQVAKNLSEEQVAAVIQKIRQIQRDLITAVMTGSEIDWRKDEK